MTDQKPGLIADTAAVGGGIMRERLVAEDYAYDPDNYPNCQTCLGEGFEDCDDADSSEGCWQHGCNGDFHRCPNCKGSGLAKDQWYW